jgi:glycosyltransferase involved in cell wall biosynthesis
MKAAHQFVTALSYGDAIGDYTIEIQKILRRNGYESEIFTEVVQPRMAKYAKPLSDYEMYMGDDVLELLHFSIGSKLGYLIPHFKGKKMMIYHNITPHRWFVDINSELAYQCFVGRRQLEFLKRFCPVALADSEYNRQELEAAGYKNTGVLQIRLNFDKFSGAGDPVTRELYNDNRTNIIVVGRVIPNKKLEDCLKAFAYYQKYINPLSRLIFVGLWSGFNRYYYALREICVRLQLQEVVFTGHVTFEELLSYYRLADGLIIMSEHEGFCVPLLEAFAMKVPVLAWGDCAIPYTAGQGGIIASEEKDFAEFGEMLQKLCSPGEFRNRIIESQLAQIRVHNEYPFEQTLLNALESLKKTLPVKLEEVEKEREITPAKS